MCTSPANRTCPRGPRRPESTRRTRPSPLRRDGAGAAARRISCPLALAVVLSPGACSHVRRVYDAEVPRVPSALARRAAPLRTARPPATLVVLSPARILWVRGATRTTVGRFSEGHFTGGALGQLLRHAEEWSASGSPVPPTYLAADRRADFALLAQVQQAVRASGAPAVLLLLSGPGKDWYAIPLRPAPPPGCDVGPSIRRSSLGWRLVPGKRRHDPACRRSSPPTLTVHAPGAARWGELAPLLLGIAAKHGAAGIALWPE